MRRIHPRLRPHPTYTTPRWCRKPEPRTPAAARATGSRGQILFHQKYPRTEAATLQAGMATSGHRRNGRQAPAGRIHRASHDDKGNQSPKASRRFHVGIEPKPRGTISDAAWTRLMQPQPVGWTLYDTKEPRAKLRRWTLRSPGDHRGRGRKTRGELTSRRNPAEAKRMTPGRVEKTRRELRRVSPNLETTA